MLALISTVRIRKFIGGLGALALMSAAPAMAADNMKIGFVDIDQVASRSATIQAAVKASEDKIQAAQTEIEQLSNELRRVQDDMKTKRSVMSEAEMKKQNQKAEDLRDQIETKERAVNKEIRRAETEVMGPAVDRILNTVKQVGKANGFGLILRSDVVLYGAEGLDITAIVVKELDKTGGKK